LSQSVRENTYQCIHSATFGLIVHGLWPQAAQVSSVRAHPRNCRNEPQLNTTFVKRFYCMMPDEVLMQAEWEKHGKGLNEN
jgi:ribonuclease T2